MPPAPLLAAHLAHFGMVVLIWLVQLVVYPAFRFVEADTFRAWHSSYGDRITVIVLPLMFVQLGLSLWRLWDRPSVTSVLVLGLVLAAWAVTFLLSVPDHGRLQAEGKNLEVIDHLVRTNWLRTFAWTAAWLVFLLDSWRRP